MIPGVLGSRLEREDGTEAWPGNIGKLVFSRYETLAMRINEDTLNTSPNGLQPARIFDKAAGQQYYSRIIEVLQGPEGYRRGTPGVQGDQVVIAGSGGARSDRSKAPVSAFRPAQRVFLLRKP